MRKFSYHTRTLLLCCKGGSQMALEGNPKWKSKKFTGNNSEMVKVEAIKMFLRLYIIIYNKNNMFISFRPRRRMETCYIILDRCIYEFIIFAISVHLKFKFNIGAYLSTYMIRILGTHGTYVTVRKLDVPIWFSNEINLFRNPHY